MTRQPNRVEPYPVSLRGDGVINGGNGLVDQPLEPLAAQRVEQGREGIEHRGQRHPPVGHQAAVGSAPCLDDDIAVAVRREQGDQLTS